MGNARYDSKSSASDHARERVPWRRSERLGYAPRAMVRHFNTAGPCRADLHYMLPPERRIPRLREAVEQQAYFVVHAPRQVGKTTALLSFAQTLTREGRFASAVVSMEVGAAFPNDIGAAEDAILGTWRRRAAAWLPESLLPPSWPDAKPGERISAALTAWCEACPRPLVLFLDEIDALRDSVLMGVLRQLRDGHANRPGAFPWSLALVGLRDVRDYKIASGGSDHLHTASPFNIKVESFTLRDFHADEVAELYAQHTGDTGQRFEPEALARAFELTQGQPWLVNALARQLTEVIVRDRAVAITAADVDTARDLLIERQDTHLDSLAERLRDPRVRAVIEPMILGSDIPVLPPDDLRYVLDLGLVRQWSDGTIEVANPIYREVILRDLAFAVRASIPKLKPTWLRPDGHLDEAGLLEGLLKFWREHAEILLKSSPYSEAAAHLVLLAFLFRVTNGGGRVYREYAAGSGRLDLRLEFHGDVLAIEVKTWRDSDKVKDPVPAGVAQLDEYLARLGLDRGWLVLCDQRKDRPGFPEGIAAATVTSPAGRAVTVVRL